MRLWAVLVIGVMLGLGCAAEPSEGDRTGGAPARVASPSPVAQPAPAELESAVHPVVPPPDAEAEVVEPEPESGPAAEPDPPPPRTGPEPGSPESDAELLALLDESTITQAEFAAAFAKPAPGEAVSLSDLLQTRSKVSVGSATVEAGTVDPKQIEAAAKADLHELEMCHAMALSKKPSDVGQVTLELEFEAGKVESVSVEGKTSEALNDCLGTVADGWTAAGQGTVRLELTLSTQ